MIPSRTGSFSRMVSACTHQTLITYHWIVQHVSPRTKPTFGALLGARSEMARSAVPATSARNAGRRDNSTFTTATMIE